jgi:phage-related protein
METLTLRGQVGSSGSGEFDIFKSQFSDGYSQSIPNGIDNEKQKWQMVFSGKEAAPALAFIRARKGEVFAWTPPMGVSGAYSCARYSISDEGGAYMTVSAEFEQAHSL